MEPSVYAERKQLFIQKRKAFKENPESAADLVAYANGDNDHNYTVLKGFIPHALIGKKMPGGHGNWEKSDTFFSDYLNTHPDQVFSETADSLVIGNTASHDKRQYLAKWDPDGKDKTATAGMSYMHIMVIPKKRVYNAVALDDTSVIKELVEHFRSFWSRPESIAKVTGWFKITVDQRASAVRASLESHAPEKVDSFNGVMKEVIASSEKFSDDLRLQYDPTDEDAFLLGFHPAPEASIGHLHMHVILLHPEFRQFSADIHDWKTVPAQAVIEVIEEEIAGRRYDTHSTEPWWRRTLTRLGLVLSFGKNGTQA